jgi:AraC-like DNA-binding protein
MRSALLVAFVDAAKTLGLDPYHMLRRAGLPVAALDQPDMKIPADRVQALLADCARAASCEEFGLLVGAAFKLSMKGALGLLLREQATVRDAVDVLQRYLRYQNDSVEIAVENRGGGLLLAPQLLSPRSSASRQMVDMTLAMYVRIFRGLLGDDWTPRRVTIARAAPADMKPYFKVLGAVQFEAPVTGFLLTEEDLSTVIPDADVEMAREIARYIVATATPESVSFSDTVSALILRLLPEGECSVDRVAQHLGVDRRTIHRRLALEGKSFTQLLETARRDVATWQLSHGDQPLSEVTALVGFSSLSTFSRWFRQAYGIQPSEFRRLAHHA